MHISSDTVESWFHCILMSHACLSVLYTVQSTRARRTDGSDLSGARMSRWSTLSVAATLLTALHIEPHSKHKAPMAAILEAQWWSSLLIWELLLTVYQWMSIFAIVYHPRHTQVCHLSFHSFNFNTLSRTLILSGYAVKYVSFLIGSVSWSHCPLKFHCPHYIHC